jgi:hypothetical protein
MDHATEGAGPFSSRSHPLGGGNGAEGEKMSADTPVQRFNMSQPAGSSSTGTTLSFQTVKPIAGRPNIRRNYPARRRLLKFQAPHVS